MLWEIWFLHYSSLMACAAQIVHPQPRNEQPSFYHGIYCMLVAITYLSSPSSPRLLKRLRYTASSASYAEVEFKPQLCTFPFIFFFAFSVSLSLTLSLSPMKAANLPGNDRRSVRAPLSDTGVPSPGGESHTTAPKTTLSPLSSRGRLPENQPLNCASHTAKGYAASTTTMPNRPASLVSPPSRGSTQLRPAEPQSTTSIATTATSTTNTMSITIEPASTAGARFPVPPNAPTILSQCLTLQGQLRQKGWEREAAFFTEYAVKRSRLGLLRRQQQRREAQHRVDAEAIARTAAMLDELAGAVRDHEVTLRPDGYQAFLFPNGDVYEGSWKNRRMHGKGCLCRAEARDIYEGQWFLGQRCGPGTLRSGDFKTFYSGAWLDNKRHGRGELVEPEGVYTGEFIDNRISGFGEYVYHDGHVYRGDWRDGFYHGSGVYMYPSGSKYDGSWHHGYEEGRGTRFFPNGDVYAGEWHEGVPHGHGTYTTSTFSYHNPNATATISVTTAAATSNTATTTSAGFPTTTTAGSTTSTVITTATAAVAASATDAGADAVATAQRAFRYEGQWVFGVIQGTGTCTFGDGTTYSGRWHNGQPHGMGIAQFAPLPIHAALYRVEAEERETRREMSEDCSGSRATSSAFATSSDGVGGLRRGADEEQAGVRRALMQPASTTYAGEFFRGRRDGYGVYDGPLAQFAGQWRRDEKEGYGTFKARGCGALEGLWRADVPRGKALYTAAGGSLPAPSEEHLRRAAAVVDKNAPAADAAGEDGHISGDTNAALVDHDTSDDVNGADARFRNDERRRDSLLMTSGGDGWRSESVSDFFHGDRVWNEHMFVVHCDDTGTCTSVAPRGCSVYPPDVPLASLNLRLKNKDE